MTTVRFEDVENTEMVRVSFRYDPELVSLVKQVSPGLRSYDPSTKSWSVHESVAEQLVESMIVAGHDVAGAEPAAAVTTPSIEDFFGVSPPKDDFDAKAMAAEIIAGIPAQFVGRVFRAMARQLYPDLYPARNR